MIPHFICNVCSVRSHFEWLNRGFSDKTITGFTIINFLSVEAVNYIDFPYNARTICACFSFMIQ